MPKPRPPVSPPPAAWHEPAVHPGYLRPFATLLTQHGIDAETLLTRHTLSPSAISNDRLVAFAPMHDAIAEAIALTQRPWLGLEFGALVHPLSHGQVGFASAASDTLRGALQTVSRFTALRTRAVRFVLHNTAGQTELRIDAAFDLGQARAFVLEACLVIVDRLLTALSGQACADASYALPWPCPPWAWAYAQHLSAPVQFDASALSLRFPDALLDRTCLSADTESFQVAQHECQRRLEYGHPQRDLIREIRRRLMASPGDYPGAERMAQQLNVSTRSLFRHLRAEGLSYRGLIDTLRCEQARWFLHHTDEPVETIAERLGYADGSNFSRTFKRWTRTTPNECRLASRTQPGSDAKPAPKPQNPLAD